MILIKKYIYIYCYQHAIFYQIYIYFYGHFINITTFRHKIVNFNIFQHNFHDSWKQVSFICRMKCFNGTSAGYLVGIVFNNVFYFYSMKYTGQHKIQCTSNTSLYISKGAQQTQIVRIITKYFN